MKTLIRVGLVLVLGMGGGAMAQGILPGDEVPFGKADMRELGESFQMRGVDGFIADRAHAIVSAELQKNLGSWVAESFKELIPPSKAHGEELTRAAVSEALAKDPELKNKVKQKISEKLQKWLPKAAKHVLEKEVWQDQIKAKTDNPILKNLENELENAFTKTMNENADRLIGDMYEKIFDQFGLQKVMEPAQRISRLDDVIRETLNQNNIYQLADRLSGYLGTQTVRSLKQNVLTSLKDNLPDDFAEALLEGPDALEAYADKFKKYLPTRQLADLKNKIESIELFEMPNQIYGAILAIQTVRHISKGVASCPACDVLELKRGAEVAKTMIQQLKNKESISVNIGSFLGALKILEDKLGKINWKGLDKIKKWGPGNQYFKQMAKLEKKFKKVDEWLEKGKGKFFDKYRSLLDEFTGDMVALSDKMLDPLRDLADKVNIPDLPDLSKYDNFKDLTGLGDALFGEKGNFTAWDKVKESKVGDWLHKANSKASDWLGGGAANIAEKLNGLKWVAKILEVEKVPAKNRSTTNDFDPVFLHNGEFYSRIIDVTLPGEGIDFQFSRSYRSVGRFMSPLGMQWHHNFQTGLKFLSSPEENGMAYLNEEGLKYFFRRNLDGSFLSPKNYPAMLEAVDVGYRVTYESGRQLHFDRDGLLQKITVPDEGEMEVLYDGERVSQVIHNGNPVTFHYGETGLLERLEDHTGRNWSFDHDREGRLIGATTPGTPAFPKGKTTRYRYDDNDRMILVMDPKGQIYLENHYGTLGESTGKVVLQHYGNGTTAIEARYDGRVTSVSDRRGILHRYHHNDDGELVKQELQAGDEWKSADVGNENGKPGENEIEERKDLNEYRYDRWGNISEIKTPNGDLRRLKVDAGNLVTEEDFNGEIRRYTYDANDNIVRTEIPSRGLMLEYEYDPLDHLVAKHEKFSGQTLTTRHEYDPQGRLARYVFPLGNDIRFYYDEAGDLTREVWAEGTPLERVVIPSSPEEASQSFDSQPEVLSRAYPNKPEIAYDPIGRPLKANHVVYAWDDNGRLASLTDPKVGESRFEYDILNRLVREVHPDGKERRFSYDAQNRLSGFVDKEGREHRLEYDAAGNVAARICGDQRLDYFYDAENRLIEARSDQVTLNRRYDAEGRVIGEAINDRWTTFTYNESGQKTGIRTPSGFQTVRLFDESGQLAQIFAGAELILNLEEVAEGVVWGNGVRLQEKFNGDQLSKQSYSFPGSKETYGWDYTYDQNQKLIRTMALQDRSVQQYHYNKEGELVSSKASTEEDSRFRYKFDPWNRLTEVADLDGNVLVRYTIDPLGRVIAREERNHREDYAYDEWNRVESADLQKQARQWIYGDSLDQPAATFSGGQIHYYHADRLGSIRYISDASGKLVEAFDYSPFGKRTALQDDSDFVADLGYLGRSQDSTTGLVNMRYRFYDSALGRFISEDPYGFKNDFFRSSKVRTPLNLAFHMGQGGSSRNTYANYVEKNGQKFLLDTQLFSEASLPQAQVPELDLYAYASNDPINLRDPLGLYTVDIVLPPWGPGTDARRFAGELVILDNDGHRRAGPFKALGRSSSRVPKLDEKGEVVKDKKGKTVIVDNGNVTRDPVKNFGDTPTGKYTPAIEDHRNDPKWSVAAYGPNPIIRMNPISGDALTAASNNRKGLLIHGGNLGTNPSHFPDGLRPTYGCVRISNTDMATLIEMAQKLDEEENQIGKNSEDVINISEDKKFIRRK